MTGAVLRKEEAGAGTALDLALARTAEEVLRCRDTVLTVEQVLHALIEAAPARTGVRVTDLQAIDLLDQRLADLARWLGALSAAAGGTVLAPSARDLAADLRLADLRHRLCDGEGGPQAPRHELF